MQVLVCICSQLLLLLHTMLCLQYKRLFLLHAIVIGPAAATLCSATVYASAVCSVTSYFTSFLVLHILLLITSHIQYSPTQLHFTTGNTRGHSL